MKRQTLLLLTLPTLVGSALALAPAPQWRVQPDAYSIKFDTRGASGTIRGLKGSIAFDAANLPASSFAVSVDVNTLDTGNGLKNRHAKAEGFFDAAHYPLIQYTSSKVEKTAKGFTSTGQLKIKGVSKPVVIPFTFEQNGGTGTFKGHFQVNREDFNLHKFGVGEIVDLELVVPVKK